MSATVTVPVPQLLTLDETSKALRMSKSKLRQEERAGRLRFLRFGRVVRVDARDLENYVNSVRGESSGDQRLPVTQKLASRIVTAGGGARQ